MQRLLRPACLNRPQRDLTMDRKGASRQIAALKAILKTLLPEDYLTQSGGLPKDNFLEPLEKDEPIVMGITNELIESEIEGAFGRPKRARKSCARPPLRPS